MSKQRFFKNIQAEIKNEIAKIVLRKFQYKCCKCTAKHNSEVIRTGNKYSDPIDQHEKEFYISSGIKTIKIFLRVIQIKGIPGTTDPEDYLPFCPMHAQTELKEKILAVKKKKIGDLSHFRIQHITEVKNYIFSCTGRAISTRDAIGLIMRLDQVSKN